MRVLVVAVPLAVLVVGVSGCSGPVQSTRMRGPDGSTNWVAITCRHEIQCEERAGEACHGGYDVSRRSQHDMIVKCHGRASSAGIDPGRYRECMGTESCNTGDECVFVPRDASMGRCRPEGHRDAEP